jgi:hypothetical protein
MLQGVVGASMTEQVIEVRGQVLGSSPVKPARDEAAAASVAAGDRMSRVGPHRPRAEYSNSPATRARHRLWLPRVKPGYGVDLLRCHSVCDVAHLRAYVIAPGAEGESLELRVQAARGLPSEPRRTGIVGEFTVACIAGGYVSHWGTVGVDARTFALRRRSPACGLG